MRKRPCNDRTNKWAGFIQPTESQELLQIGQRRIITDIVEPVEETSVSTPCLPLELTTTRPIYIPAQTSPVPATGPFPFYVKLGTIENVLANNFNSVFTYAADTITHVYAEVTLGQMTTLTVASWTIMTATTLPPTSAGWTSSTTRPPTINIPLGYISHVTGGGVQIIADSGDFTLEEYLTSVRIDGGYTRHVRAVRR